jgi:hypothetical protein
MGPTSTYTPYFGVNFITCAGSAIGLAESSERRQEALSRTAFGPTEATRDEPEPDTHNARHSMTDWTPLPQGVTWKGPPLMNFRASRATMQRSFGEPHQIDIDSNGLGLFGAWSLRFPCGLEMCLWIFHSRRDFSEIADIDEPANIEVHANAAHEKHIRFHLPFPVINTSRWEPSPMGPEPLVWRVLRQDDNGNVFEVERLPSRCEANAVVASFEARGHKQMYWVEQDEGRH